MLAAGIKSTEFKSENAPDVICRYSLALTGNCYVDSIYPLEKLTKTSFPGTENFATGKLLPDKLKTQHSFA